MPRDDLIVQLMKQSRLADVDEVISLPSRRLDLFNMVQERTVLARTLLEFPQLMPKLLAIYAPVATIYSANTQPIISTSPSEDRYEYPSQEGVAQDALLFAAYYGIVPNSDNIRGGLFIPHLLQNLKKSFTFRVEQLKKTHPVNNMNTLTALIASSGLLKEDQVHKKFQLGHSFSLVVNTKKPHFPDDTVCLKRKKEAEEINNTSLEIGVLKCLEVIRTLPPEDQREIFRNKSTSNDEERREFLRSRYLNDQQYDRKDTVIKDRTPLQLAANYLPEVALPILVQMMTLDNLTEIDTEKLNPLTQLLSQDWERILQAPREAKDTLALLEINSKHKLNLALPLSTMDYNQLLQAASTGPQKYMILETFLTISGKKIPLQQDFKDLEQALWQLYQDKPSLRLAIEEQLGVWTTDPLYTNKALIALTLISSQKHDPSFNDFLKLLTSAQEKYGKIGNSCHLLYKLYTDHKNTKDCVSFILSTLKDIATTKKYPEAWLAIALIAHKQASQLKDALSQQLSANRPIIELDPQITKQIAKLQSSMEALSKSTEPGEHQRLKEKTAAMEAELNSLQEEKDKEAILKDLERPIIEMEQLHEHYMQLINQNAPRKPGLFQKAGDPLCLHLTQGTPLKTDPRQLTSFITDPDCTYEIEALGLLPQNGASSSTLKIN